MPAWSIYHNRPHCTCPGTDGMYCMCGIEDMGKRSCTERVSW
jgi:hypothetical protein